MRGRKRRSIRAGAGASTATATSAARWRFFHHGRASPANGERRQGSFGPMAGGALRHGVGVSHGAALFELGPAGGAEVLVDGHARSIADEQTVQAARVARRRRTRAAVRVAGAAVRCGIGTTSARVGSGASGGNSATAPLRIARVIALEGSTHALLPLALSAERRRATRCVSQRNIHDMGSRQ